MLDRKTFKQKHLGRLQCNISQNPDLYRNDFYAAFDKFLFNYSIVLLNPYKKNDLFCSQVIFLGYTSFFYSKENENREDEFFKYDDDNESLYDLDIEELENEESEKYVKEEEEEEEKEEEKNVKNVYKNDNMDENSENSENEYDEMLKIKLELKKKELLQQIEENKLKKDNLKKKNENPLIPYENLNDYINVLIVKNKENINFIEEVFFLLTQLLIQMKHKLYCTILLSCLRALNKLKNRILPVKFIQILIFLHDIKSNRLKSYNFFNIVKLIIKINKKGKNEKLKDEILSLLHEAFIENSQRKKIRRKYATLNFHYFSHMTIPEGMNNFSCSILIELAKKKIYINKKNINMLAEGIYYKNQKIVKCICYALLGKHTNKELIVKIEKEKIKKRNYIEELKHINNKSHAKLTKSKIKKLHEQKAQIMADIAKGQNISEDEDERLEKEIAKYVDYTFIDLIYDIHKFSNNLFNLICSKFQFSSGIIKFLFLNILCRIYQRHKIVEENFFLYFENSISHIKSKKILSKYLTIFIQCIHDDIPNIFIQRIIYILIKKFVCEYLSEEIVYLTINAINEMILKCPSCLNKDIYEGVIIFRKYKNKNIAQVVRRFINICKRLDPAVVDQKLMDKNSAMLLQKKKLLGNETNEYENTILQYTYLLNKLEKKEKTEETEEEVQKRSGKKRKKSQQEEGQEKYLDSDEDEQIENDEEKDLESDEEKDLESDEEKDLESDEEKDLESDEEKDLESDEEKDLESDEEELIENDEEEQIDSDEEKDLESDKEECHEMDKLTDTTDSETSNENIDGDDNENSDDANKIQPDPKYENDADMYRGEITRKRKKPDKRLRREKRKNEELQKVKETENILCKRILDENDFKKLKKMKSYIESNNNIVLSELREICELTSESNESESDSDDSADGKEKIITEEDLMYKKKVKKGEVMKSNKKMKKKENIERFKTNKEKEKTKPIKMVCEKKRKKKNFIIEYGRLKKKLKGQKKARSRKNRFMNRRAAKTLRKRAM